MPLFTDTDSDSNFVTGAALSKKSQDSVSSNYLSAVLDRFSSNVATLEAGRWVFHPNGFREWREYPHNGAPRIRKRQLVTEETAKLLSEKYNAYFYALTGKQLDFVITPTAQPYLSMLEACRHRDQILQTLFEKRPKIWELMGGSGGDAIAFMLDLDPEELVIVEYGIGDQGEKTREKKALVHNIHSFCECFDEYRGAFDPEDPGKVGNRVRVEYMTAKNFIEKANPVNRTTRTRAPMHINMVYLDPSWDKAFYQAIEGEDRAKYESTDRVKELEEEHNETYNPNEVEEYESKPEDLFHYLEEQVWEPMKRNNITVDVYVLKTRWEWSSVSRQLEKVNSDYYVPYSIQAIPFQEHINRQQPGLYGEIKGQFHWIVMVHKKYRSIKDERHEWYMDLIRRGQKIYVDGSSVVKPFHPRYADHLLFPKVYQKPTPGCFEVTPPDYHEKAQRAGKSRRNEGGDGGSEPSPSPAGKWEERRKAAEEREDRSTGPGYRGRFDTLHPESESRLKSSIVTDRNR